MSALIAERDHAAEADRAAQQLQLGHVVEERPGDLLVQLRIPEQGDGVAVAIEKIDGRGVEQDDAA
jgi:hypothetical protein